MNSPEHSHYGFIDNKKLKEIRDNTDWRKVFTALGLKKDEKKSKDQDWWAISPLSNEKTASFHLNNNGWYCHSTRQGGGVIELIQSIHGGNYYQAIKWLLEHQCSFLGTPTYSNPQKPHTGDLTASQAYSKPRSEKKKEENLPIRQNLLSCLSQKGSHPQFVKRGISKETCDYLGCGFLDRPKSGDMHERIVFPGPGGSGKRRLP